MASLGFSFDANTVAPSAPMGPVPAGDYNVIITGSEIKPTRAGNGTFAKFTVEIIDGEHKGRRVMEIINLTNPSAQCVDIGRAQLSALCRAVGVMTPGDTAALHNRPCRVTLDYEPANEKGQIFNKIKQWHAGAGHCHFAPAAPAAPAVAPWERKTA